MVDAPLPPRLATVPANMGHDAVHVRTIGMRDASDQDILGFALQDQRVVVTLDLHFAAIVASRGLRQPSVLILRVGNVTADEMIGAAVRGIMAAGRELSEGIVAMVDSKQVRIRHLPI